MPVYYARCRNLPRIGPFPSYERASQAVLGVDGCPLPDAFVWAEGDPPSTQNPTGRAFVAISQARSHLAKLKPTELPTATHPHLRAAIAAIASLEASLFDALYQRVEHEGAQGNVAAGDRGDVGVSKRK